MPIQWGERGHFQVGATRFRAIDLGIGDFESTPDLFVLQKSRSMIERYQQIVEAEAPRNILELGIWCGGSCVLLQRLSGGKVVAVDRDDRTGQVLRRYCEEQQLSDYLRPHFGIDQADTRELRRIVGEEFGNEPLDLVTDDASHFLDESRLSFNCLFPLLRPGGKYIVEDWTWAHGPLDLEDDHPAFHPDREPLTRLIFECVLACASAPDVVAHIEIDHNLVIITRGAGELDQHDFDIRACCLARGRALIKQ